MKLADMTVTTFTDTVASDAPAPGGGSVAALAGSIGAALTAMVGWIAPITVYPGEDELLALAQAALRVLRGEEQAKSY